MNEQAEEPFALRTTERADRMSIESRHSILYGERHYA